MKSLGKHILAEFYGCSFDVINDCQGIERLFVRVAAEAIRNFVIELCDLIEMKRFGECHVVNFGEEERVAGLIRQLTFRVAELERR